MGGVWKNIASKIISMSQHLATVTLPVIYQLLVEIFVLSFKHPLCYVGSFYDLLWFGKNDPGSVCCHNRV